MARTIDVDTLHHHHRRIMRGTTIRTAAEAALKAEEQLARRDRERVEQRRSYV